MPIYNVPNEVGLEEFMIATEAIPGTFAVPIRRMTQQFDAQPGVGELIVGQDVTGGYNRTARARRGTKDPSGSLGGRGDLTFQELAMFARYFIRGGVTGTSDAETIPGYTFDFSNLPNADDIQTFSALFGVPGLEWMATGVRFDEINISGDATNADNAWKISGTPFLKEAKRYHSFEGVATGGSTTTIVLTGAGWTSNQWQGAYVFQDFGSGVGETRMVASNTTDTLTLESPLATAAASGDKFSISTPFPTLSDPDYDTISMEGTKIFLDIHDPSSSTIGTTNVSERVASFNVTQKLNLANKRRAPGIISRKGRGNLDITGQITFEADRWDEYYQWIENDYLSIRIEKEGPLIDPDAGTRHLAQLNFERAAWNTRSPGTDNHNKMVTMAFRALRHTPDWNVKVKTNLATLA